jgi:hypothetical protein
MFNAVQPLSTISEEAVKNKQRMQENDSCGKVIYFELFGENCIKIITTGQDFRVNLYEFLLLGRKFKPKFK